MTASSPFRIDHLLDAGCVLASSWLRDSGTSIGASWPYSEPLWWYGDPDTLRLLLNRTLRSATLSGPARAIVVSARPSASANGLTVRVLRHHDGVTNYHARGNNNDVQHRARKGCDQWAFTVAAAPIAVPEINRTATMPAAVLCVTGDTLCLHTLKRQLAGFGTRLVPWSVGSDAIAARNVCDTVFVDEASISADQLDSLKPGARIIGLTRRWQSEYHEVLHLPASTHRLAEILMHRDNVHASPGQLVLLAEDSPPALYTTRLMLEKLGHEVVCVADGRAAVERCERYRFDLILMDMQMPELSGMESMGLIRNSGLNQHCRIVALTGMSDSASRHAIIAGGADQCLFKPANLAAMQTCIDNPHIKFLDPRTY